MRYLKGTMTLGLHYQKYPTVLEGYSDADWNTLSDDSKATSGYIFNIAGGAVSWKSKKQTILAQSTMEYEMIALTTASEEVMSKTTSARFYRCSNKRYSTLLEG